MSQSTNDAAAAAPLTLPRELCFSLRRDEWGQLILIDADGVRHLNVEPIPNFPISDPKRWVSICESDGREIVCIEEPEQLPAGVRQLLEDEVSRREFAPIIEQIVHVSGVTEPCEWQVKTDRGPTQFVLKSEDDVRRVGDQQIIIYDANGIRYLVPDVNQLDTKSRRIVEWYV